MTAVRLVFLVPYAIIIIRISVVLHLFGRSYVAAVLKAKCAENLHLVLSSLEVK